ncbi:HAMP domain-containing sensor histidine kinase [Nocardia sp. NPDC046473]|uniref:sensor histidine kinase n=1 Tax=Nocardia sp. NPDC046473 TaxID=3155733 RepID=UPI0033DDFC54
MQSAFVLAVVLLLVGIVLVLVDGRIRDHQLDAQLAEVAAEVDDIDDPPPGMALGIVDQTGNVSISAHAPESTAGLATGPAGYSTVRSAGVEYRALVVESSGRRLAVLADKRPWDESRDRVLEALLIAELAGLATAAGAAVLLSRRAIGPMAAALTVQRDFVADASHELRAPLTVLHTRAQLLARRAAREQLAPEWRSQLDGLVADTRALAGIVDDLLLAAAAEDESDRFEPVDVAALCREVGDSVAAYATTRGIDIAVEVGDSASAPLVEGLRPALRRAVFALVDNAMQHEKDGGTVTIRVSRTADEVAVTVSDTGAGLDPRDAERFFRRFAHGDGHRAGTRSHGIGLALVRAVVDAHRGRIMVDGAPGRGAAFTIELPAAQGE